MEWVFCLFVCMLLGFGVFCKHCMISKREPALSLKKEKYFKTAQLPTSFHYTKQFLYSITLFSIFLMRVGYKTDILLVYNLLILKCLKRKCDSPGYFVVRSTSFPAVLYRRFFCCCFVGFICLF